MGKTIRIRKSGGSTITLSNVELITRKLDRQLKKRPFPKNKTAIIDRKNNYHTFELKWRPDNEGGTTKEQKIDDLVTFVKNTTPPLIFDWGVSPESGFRSFNVACDDVQEIETGGEVSSSLVMIKLIEGHKFTTVT